MIQIRQFHQQVLMHQWVHGRNAQIALRVLLGFLLAFFVANLALFLYPDNRFLPFHSIGGVPVGGLTDKQAEEKIDEFIAGSNNETLEITFEDGEMVTVSYAELGLAVDSGQTVNRELRRYRNNTWPIERVKESFSDGDFITEFDLEAVDIFLEPYLQQYTKPAVSAQVLIEGGEPVVVPHENGSEIDANAVTELVASALNDGVSQLFIPVTQVVPEQTTTEVETFRSRIVASSKALVTVQGLDSQNITATPAQILSWTVIEDREQEGLSLVYDSEAITAFVSGFSLQYFEPPVNTVVTIVDGQETDRVAGTPGVSTNDSVAVQSIVSGLQNGDSTINVQLAETEILPEVVSKQSYSQTNAGLSRLIADWANDHNGTYGVHVEQLSGGNSVATLNGNRGFVTASTYKMFLAYTILKEVEDDNMKLSDPSGYSDYTVQQCIHEMIVQSTNFCSVPLGWLIGWDRADQILAQAGFTATRLNNYNASRQFNGDKMSTASEEARFLAQLQGGSLLNGQNTSYLLGLMRSQVHRRGIPSGVPGVAVADKVGFLEGYTHDVGIVYADSGTYVIAIMSLWGSWSDFADLSERVHDHFSQ